MDRKRILAFALGPIGTGLLSLISVPLIAWQFSTTDLGRNTILQTFISFSILLTILGLDQVYVREFHETRHKANLLKVCFVPGFLFFAVVFAVSTPFANQISTLLYGRARAGWYFLTAACAALAFISRFLTLLLRMEERGLAFSLTQLIPKITLLIVVLLYALLGVTKEYTYLLAAQLSSVLAAAAISLWLVRGQIRSWLTATIQNDELVAALKFGIPLVGAGLAYWGLSATSTIAIRTFASFHELGIYSMAMSLAGAATILQSIFSTIWMPTVYKWVAEGRDLTRINETQSSLLAFICLSIATVEAFSWILDFLLPEAYKQVKFIVACCMAQPLLYTLSETTVVGLNVQRRSTTAAQVAGFAFAVNAALSTLMTPYLGARGAAIANVVAYVCFFVARTEMAAIAWGTPPNRSLYTRLCPFVILMIITALFGHINPLAFTTFWSAITLATGLMFRVEIAKIYGTLRG